MENTMQQEAEKIELELPEGEVDISAADVDDSIKEEKIVEVVAEKKDELDQISESVQKRIDKLTYKMREAERQRDEAVTYAQSINQSNSNLKEKLKNSDTSLFKEYDNRIQSDIERAKINLREAQDTGDGNAVADATEKLSRASAESENLKRLSLNKKLKNKELLKRLLLKTTRQHYSRNKLQPQIQKLKHGQLRMRGLEMTKL